MTLKVTVLGCGGSIGVPTLGFGWGACDPDEPKNNRTRPAILIEQDGFTVLVDAGPDIRNQLLRHKVQKIDAVVCTHGHADHMAGLDDIRPLMIVQDINMPFYGLAATIENVQQRCGYLFQPDDAPPETRRKNDMLAQVIDRMGTLNIGPMLFQLFEQWHGYEKSLGIRIGDFAYSTDVNKLEADALKTLAGVDTWLVDCNNRTMTDSYKHADLAQVLEWNKVVQARQVFLTHLPSWHDYAALKAQCPDHVEPAYDGLQLAF